MKRKTSILFFAICLTVLALLLCACEGAPEENGDKVKIVTTIFPEYDFARQIAGDRAEVTMLIDSGDLHSYEPTLSDITKISKCDLFVYIGGNSYSWVNSVLDKIKSEDMTALNLFEHADKLYESSDGIYQPDHEHEEDHEHSALYDEHIWTSPVNAMKMCKAIADELCKIDPQNAQYYNENYLEYTAKLAELDDDIRKCVSEAKGNTLVVADRFPFLYLCSEYEIGYFAAMSGCGSASDISLSTVIALSDTLKNSSLDSVVVTESSSGNITSALKKQLGGYSFDTLVLHSCQYVGKSEIEDGASYLSIMKQNVEILREALN